MANTKLTRTPSSAGNRKTFTISIWIKRSELSSSSKTVLDSNFNGGASENRIYLNNNSLEYYDYASSAYQLRYITNKLLRDVSAWYHIVIAVDTTQGTAANRVKIYINGVQETSFSTEQNPSQNLDTQFNTANLTQFGAANAGVNFFDGSMSHIHFIDGTAYDATAFGQYDANGVWTINTSPSVTYGTNGFFILKNGNSVTDQSGNGNNFTVGGGTLTNTEDNPSNVFCTVNPLDNYYPACTFSNGNTTVATGNNYSYCQSTIYVNKGKWYWEVKAVSKASGADEFMIGIQGKSATGTNIPAQSNNGITYYKDGDTYGFGGGATSYGNSYTVGDIIGVALDCDNNKLYFSKNGTWQNSGDPTSGATGTGALAITDPNDVPQGGYSPVGGAYTSVSHTLSFNFGNGYFGTTAVSSAGTNASGIGIFEYDVPTGYTALSTKGLNL